MACHGPAANHSSRPPDTMEMLRPNQTQPLTTRKHYTGATSDPLHRDTPARGPQERGGPRSASRQRLPPPRTHYIVDYHAQTPRDHPSMVAALQSHTLHPNGPRAPRHRDPRRPMDRRTQPRPSPRSPAPHRKFSPQVTLPRHHHTVPPPHQVAYPWRAQTPFCSLKQRFWGRSGQL